MPMAKRWLSDGGTLNGDTLISNEGDLRDILE